eukprot:14128954-Ditylum_brightwellii.AAC.1
MMKSQSLQGIAVGLDESRHTATSFNLKYNGGMFIGLYSADKQSSSLPELYPLGTDILSCQSDDVRIRGSVIGIPIEEPSTKSPSLSIQHYTIRLVDGNIKQVSSPTMATITCNKIKPPTIQSSQL